MVEVDSGYVPLAALVDLNGVVRRQLTEERDEIAVAVPLDLEAEIGNRPHAVSCEEGLGVSFVLQLLQFRVVHQKQLDHASVFRAQRMLIFGVKVLQACIGSSFPEAI